MPILSILIALPLVAALVVAHHTKPRPEHVIPGAVGV